ncbi:hypothetical protein [Hymenobacter volaticus]|uniref:Swt1-like HEPN domain-containing protein n=1 Tax=Hymenobacter volaticus TaxID=2932254 RepID=A0ABY4G7A7_9BACT|nr:hypothetical protein [Hymenobacter volaticus]UOQ66794.1 hypothetical protein MUN86_02410 [Hymenobacter volaticus]
MTVDQDTLERLKHLATSAATDGRPTEEDEKEFVSIRKALLARVEFQDKLPAFVRNCTNLKEVRSDIQTLGNYATRREHIRSAIGLLLGAEAVKPDPFQQVLAVTDLSKLVILPLDIQEKGKQGADCFVYLFCIENSIREFMIHVGMTETVNVPKGVQRKIDDRKSSETIRKYLPVRGSSDVYYCDFIELADIVRANWSVFTRYFPGRDEHWFTNMMKQLYEVRLLIGHNSAVGASELQFLDVFYKIIMTSLKV